MSNSTTLVDFEGAITFGTIEMLLNHLRDNAVFDELPKPVRKRLYGIFVESIDNIYKYGAGVSRKKSAAAYLPKVSVKKEKNEVVLSTSNLILENLVEDLKFKIDRVNQLDMEGLKSLYEEVINKESDSRDTGAGLGLITIAMRTCGDIRYSFHSVDEEHAYFNMQLTLMINQ